MTATRRSLRTQRIVVACPAIDRFSCLPHEILQAIFQYIREKRQLGAVCRVSKLFHRLVSPLLYDVVQIQCREGYNPRLPELKPFCADRPGTQFTASLKYVRDLALTTAFKDFVRAGERCWHYRLQRGELEEDVKYARGQGKCNFDTTARPSLGKEHGRDKAGDSNGGEVEIDEECECERCLSGSESDWSEEPEFYGDYFRDFCLGLSENGLRSFRWETGSCVPQNILGKSGYLTQHQTHIERLSLITDGACDDNMEYERPYDLAKFDRIRDFSWVGPQSKEDFEAVRACFTTNAQHLEILKLDLLDWAKADDFWYLDHTRLLDDPRRCDKFFAQDILGYRGQGNDAEHGLSFPVLHNLSLGQVSFQTAINDITGAFNLFALKRLVLWNCPGTTSLLEHLTDCEQSLQLVSFELTCGYDGMGDDWNIDFAVPPFLRKLTGLQTVCLNLPAVEWKDITDSLRMHLGTLERVVLHARTINIDEDSVYHEFEEDLQFDFYPCFYDLFTGGVCQVIGTPACPHFMRECLEPHAEDVTCKLLHLRVSADTLTRECAETYTGRAEIDSFAEWAFGPQGLPDLLVLAYGDFAFEQLCQTCNVLYCRNPSVGKAQDGTHYEVLTPSNRILWDWTIAHMDVLSACPYQSILQV